MTGKELFDVLSSSGGISSITKTPAGILIVRSSDEEPVIPENETIERVLSDGRQTELILRGNPDSLYEELNACMNAKQPFSLKRILTGIMDALSGSLVPLLPMLMAAAMFKTAASVLGPGMMNVLSENSDLYTLLSFVGDAGFYFFPIAVGYTS